MKNNNLSFYSLLAIILIAGFFTYQVLSNFLIPMFLAAILVVMFRPLHDWILLKCKGHNAIAAACTTAIILLIVLLPLVLVFSMAVKETIDLVRGEDQPQVVQRLKEIRTRFDLDIPDVELHQEIMQRLDNLNTIKPGSLSVDTTKILIHDLESLLEDYDRAIFIDQKNKLAELMKQYDEKDLDQLTSELEKRDFEQIVTIVEESTKWNSIKPKILARAASDKKLFVGLTEVNSILSEMEQGLDEKKVVPGDLIFQSYAVQLQSIFEQRMVEYFGGQPLATLKIYANPGQRESDRIKAAAIESLEKMVLPVTGAGASFAGGTIIGLAILIVSLYYFLADGPSLVSSAMKMSPLDDEYERELIKEFSTVSRAVVVATLLAAVVQGLLAGIGFWICGLESVFLLIFLTMALSMIPFFGAGSVWVPVAIWLFFVEDRIGAAIFLTIYGAAIVSMADNVIKPIILHGESKLHPLLALISVLGGVKALGPIGILVGPMLVSFLQVLLKMFQDEIGRIGDSGALGDKGAASQ